MGFFRRKNLGITDEYEKDKAKSRHDIADEYDKDKMKSYTAEDIMQISDFKMVIDDVFQITGRGTVCTGRIQQGSVKVGDELSLITNKGMYQVKVNDIEALRNKVEKATQGDEIGIVFRNRNLPKISQGDKVFK